MFEIPALERCGTTSLVAPGQPRGYALFIGSLSIEEKRPVAGLFEYQPAIYLKENNGLRRISPERVYGLSHLYALTPGHYDFVAKLGSGQVSSRMEIHRDLVTMITFGFNVTGKKTDAVFEYTFFTMDVSVLPFPYEPEDFKKPPYKITLPP